ncbi:MAG: CDP-alcohol phosphatidyltransferase family protein [Panacagrimonas sp.]
MNLWIDTGGVARAQTLFGVPPIERLRRSVGRLAAGDTVVLSGPASAEWPGARIDAEALPLGARLCRALASSAGALIVLDGANVIDPRLIRFLGGLSRSCVATREDGSRRAVALRLDASLADAIPGDAADLRAVADALLAAGRIEPLDERAFPTYIDKLRRSLPFWMYAVEDAETRRVLERRMFWDNYKGSTDLLTRYVYPPLVWQGVRFCARFGIHPNVVTVLSIILAFAAVPLWWEGQWFAGFVCAYAMSVLDSVDGKVARLTLTDSWIGNVLDHGLDQVHPPFWYYAWAIGLGATSTADPLYVVALWLIGLYVGDRLVLRVAKKRLGMALHASTRMDEIVRSVIARRNITMTIMAVALLFGFGGEGLVIVTVWQGLTMAWHAARTAWLGFLSPRRPSPEAAK